LCDRAKLEEEKCDSSKYQHKLPERVSLGLSSWGVGVGVGDVEKYGGLLPNVCG
jgi:hypothetical protein